MTRQPGGRIRIEVTLDPGLGKAMWFDCTADEAHELHGDIIAALYPAKTEPERH